MAGVRWLKQMEICFWRMGPPCPEMHDTAIDPHSSQRPGVSVAEEVCTYVFDCGGTAPSAGARRPLWLEEGCSSWALHCAVVGGKARKV